MTTLLDKYVITRDKYCFTLKECSLIDDMESKRYGQIKETTLGHYSRLTQLIDKIIGLELPISISLQELTEKIQDIETKLLVSIGGQ